MFTIPKNWLEAFFFLTTYLDTKADTGKMVIFLDELPWLATHKSGFLKGLSYFWNSWAVNKNVIVVICGSAASWMIRKVVNHRGGLHNRITKRVHLQPFTLSETEKYLAGKGIHFERYQLTQIYMAMGGIPHYLKEIQPGWSATQTINNICFSQTGLLRTEFSKLYPSLFKNAETHVAIIRCLSKKRSGMTRQQIVDATGLPEGSQITRTLEELTTSGFISSFRPFNKKKKNRLFRLTDEYSLFYLHFIEGKEHEGEDIWQYISQTPNYKTWSDYAFESICLKHIPQIKKSLSIAGIYSLSGSFYKKSTSEQEGLQIDLLIDRNDHVINLFELKFYNQLYSFTKSNVEKLQRKMALFRQVTKTNKQLTWVFLSTFGIKENQHSRSIIAKSLVLDDLFE